MSRKPRPFSCAQSVRRGGLIGALVFLGYFVACLALSAGFAVMGVENKTISDMVRQHYMGAIALAELKALAAYLILGLLAGAWAGLSAYAMARLRNHAGPRRVRAWALGFSLATETLALCRAMIDTPATFAPWFYDQGGALRAIQVWLTSEISPTLPLALLIVLYTFGPAAGLIVLIRERGLGRIASGVRALLRPWVLVLLAVIAGALIYRHCGLASRERPDQPDIVLLVADSLRPDHLGGEYDRPTSPNIDALLDQVAYFDTAYTPLARTFPAWASILSGQEPQQHGIRSMFPSYDEARLNNSLAALLSESGYRSVVLADYAGDIFPRFAAGFDEVHAPNFTMRELVRQRMLEGQRLLLPYLTNALGRRLFPELGEFPEQSDPRLLGDQVIATLERERDRPLFLATFFSVTHFPYAAPYPWYKAFSNPNYDGPYKFHKQVVPGESVEDQRDVQQIVDLFDGAILAFDVQVGRIVDYLKRSGRWNNTILIITADHGENLFEHGEDLGHGDHFRGMQSLRVPLLIKLAGGNATGHQAGLVSLLDIAPTLAEAVGTEIDWPTAGISLLPTLKQRTPLGPRTLYFESGIWFTEVSPEYFKGRRLPYPDISAIGEIDFAHGDLVTIQPGYAPLINLAKHRMRFDGRNKLIYMPTEAGIRWELYDTPADPAEARDLVPLGPSELAAQQQDLLRWIGTTPGVQISNGFAIPAQ